MRIKTMGWCLGLLCPLFAAGTVRAEQEKETTGADVVKSMAGKPECGDAGVTVAFKTGSAELDENAKGALNGVATWLNNDKARTLRLAGYADMTGDAEANLVLSERRADAVKSYLVAQGIDSTRVMTVGRGEQIDNLPANGRAVTFLACQPAAALAEGETVTPPTPLEQPEMPAPVVVAPVAVPVAVPPPPPAPKPSWARGFGWALMAGGGYQDFTDSTMRSVTNGGATWDARIVGGTHSIVGFEAAYVGAARELSTLGITANNPALVSHGLEGNLRINAPIRSGASLFEPYAYGGVGFANMRISNYNSNTAVLSSFASEDNIMNVPVGGGFAYAYKAFIADVRGGWTATFYNDLLTNDVNQSGRLNHWNFGGQAGFMF